MESGYNRSFRSKSVRQRTQKRTYKGRDRGSKNRATIERELKAERASLPGGKLAVECMDDEIVRFEKLVQVLYPWDENGKQIKSKSLQAYYWAAEMRRDYIALRAPYQSPRLSAVQIVPPGQQKRVTEVNVTILNERGETEFSDAPDDDMKLIEHEANKNDEEAA
jgi:hypothetical protein